MDSTDTRTIDDGDVDVTFVTPSSSPGVLDDVVFDTALHTVANSEDTVIKVGSTVGGVEDTTLVELENLIVGFNGDGHRSFANSSLELILSVLRDSTESSSFELASLLEGLAGAINTLVRVVSLRVNSKLLSIFKGEVHFTSVTTIVSEVS